MNAVLDVSLALAKGPVVVTLFKSFDLPAVVPVGSYIEAPGIEREIDHYRVVDNGIVVSLGTERCFEMREIELRVLELTGCGWLRDVAECSRIK
jgi:hypothetical protein